MYTDLITIQFEHEYFPVDQPLLMDCGVCDVSDGLVQSLDLLVRSTGNELVIKYKADRFDAEEILDAFADESLMLYLMPADPKLFFQVTSGWAHAVTYQRTLEQEGKTRTIDKECNTFLSFNLLAPDQLTITGVAEPIDKLDYLDDLQQWANLPQINLSRVVDKHQHDPQIPKIKAFCSQSSRIILSLPVVHLFAREVGRPLQLKFQASEFHYKYYFSDQLESIRITGDLDWHYGSEEVGGSKRLTAISSAPIKISKRPEFNLALQRKVRSGWHTIIDGLPHPKPERVFKHQDSEGESVNVIEAFIN